MLTRGVLKAIARLRMLWIYNRAATGAVRGHTPPPETVALLVTQGEQSGFVKRDGDDVTAQVEFSDGNLKVNGKPLGGLGK